MKKGRYLLALLGLAFSQSGYAIETATPPVQQVKAQGIWIDVRSAEEYQAGHLSGAIHVPHTELAARIAEISPNKEAPIHLYCRSGRRAELALTELQKLGYRQVFNHGGYDDLRRQGLQ